MWQNLHLLSCPLRVWALLKKGSGGGGRSEIKHWKLSTNDFIYGPYSLFLVYFFFFFSHLAYSPKTVVQTKKRSKIWYCLFSSLSVAGKKAFLGSLRILISHCDVLNSVAEAVQVAAYLWQSSIPHVIWFYSSMLN